MKECAKCGKIIAEEGMVDTEDTVFELVYCEKCRGGQNE